MTLGTKIGGGFCIILCLTLLQGVMSYRALDEGEETSQIIAEDRVPRLLDYSDLQSNLLQGVYYARTYFLSRDEKNLPIAMGFIAKLKDNVADLTKLNQKHYYENTAKFLDKFSKEVVQYEEYMREGKTLLDNIQNTTAALVSVGNDFESKLDELIKVMASTLRGYVEAGNSAAAMQYTRNISVTSEVFEGAVNLFENLLLAERNGHYEEYAKIRSELADVSKKFQGIYENLIRQEGRDLFNQAMSDFQAFSRHTETLAQLQQDMAKATQTRTDFFHKMYEETVQMMDLTETNTKNVVNNAAHSLNSATKIMMILIAAVMIIGIIIAILITRMIVKPLTITQRFAEAVADGDLDRELNVTSSDETGRVATALRAMVSALKTNIAEARQKSEQAQKATEEAKIAMNKAEEAARQAEHAKREGMLSAANQLEGMVEIISSASTELSAQIEQSDRGASESAQRLQEAATAMNEMNATVQEVARNAGSASTASSDTKQKAEAGEHVVRQVVQSIGEVQQVSLRLKDDMAQLNERAQDINRIMGVISDIADQTNLLALNAAIEAARAGEAGRGFAVVADEVRKLAEKTMTSTLDVSNAIRAIQESTDKSMSAVDNAVMRISEATELANQSGTALEEIVATVESTSDQVQAIAAASEEQSAASEEINRSIIEVNDMSKMTAEAMAEANQAVSDLANQAHKLTALIQQMKNG